MANVYLQTLTASGNAIITLTNIRGNLNHYTVHLYGGFGGGTVTAFTNPAGVADATGGTTNDIAILDATGVAISKTAKASFNFECNSDPIRPVVLKIILSGATNPTLTVRVDSVS